MRVRPRLWIGLLPITAFIAFTLWMALLPEPSADSDVPTIEVDHFDAVAALWTLIIPELFVLLPLLAIMWGLGWTRFVFSDADRGRPRVMLFIPIVIVVVAAIQLVWARVFEASPIDLVAIAVGTLLVGLFEEILTRGILLTGFRARFGELTAMIGSSVLFGMLHGLNVFLQPVADTIQQVLFAIGFGATLYVVRRLTGSLLLAVLLHAWWDFTSYAMDVTGHSSPGWFDWVAFVPLAVGAIAAVVVARASGNPLPAQVEAVTELRRDDRRARRRGRRSPITPSA